MFTTDTMMSLLFHRLLPFLLLDQMNFNTFWPSLHSHTFDHDHHSVNHIVVDENENEKIIIVSLFLDFTQCHSAFLPQIECFVECWIETPTRFTHWQYLYFCEFLYSDDPFDMGEKSTIKHFSRMHLYLMYRTITLSSLILEL